MQRVSDKKADQVTVRRLNMSAILKLLRERGRTLRSSIRELDPEDASYGAVLQDLSAATGQVAAELVLLTGRVRADIHGILTPEQQQSLAEMTARIDVRHERGRQAR